jgi:hypothetical protein
LGYRDSNKGARPRLHHASKKSSEPHPGIDDDGHRTDAKQGKGTRDQRKAGANHEQRAISAPETAPAETRDPGGDFRIEFGEAERQVVDVARAGSPARNL